MRNARIAPDLDGEVCSGTAIPGPTTAGIVLAKARALAFDEGSARGAR